MNSSERVRQWLGPVVFLAAAFLAADLTAAKVEQSLTVRPPTVANTVKPVIPANATAILNGLGSPGEFQFVLANTASHNPPTLVNSSVNGTTVAVSNGTAPAPALGPLPKLTGTLAGGGHSLAVLQSGDETRVCAIGESMNGYTVMEVSQFSTLLRDIQGGTHRLSLELAQASNNTTVAPPPGAMPPPLQTPGVPPPQPGVPPTPAPAGGLVTRGQMQDYMNRYQEWIGNLNVKPIKRGEEIVGMQINYRTTDNPLAKLGVATGDILTNLNGHPLKGPDDLTWALGELRNQTTLNFQLERNGQMVPLNLHLGE